MKYRQGRRNGHNIYLQRGEEPDDKDPFVGSCTTPDEATKLIVRANRPDQPQSLVLLAERVELIIDLLALPAWKTFWGRKR